MDKVIKFSIHELDTKKPAFFLIYKPPVETQPGLALALINSSHRMQELMGTERLSAFASSANTPPASGLHSKAKTTPLHRALSRKIKQLLSSLGMSLTK